MFLNWRQRLIALLAIAAGAMALRWAAPMLLSADGDAGLSLMASQLTFFGAVVVMLLASLPALAGGAVTAAGGTPMSGVFVVCVCLCFLAWAGGPIDGWLRATDQPSGYVWLIVELFVWQSLILALILFMQRARGLVRLWAPMLAVNDHPMVDADFSKPDATTWTALASGLVGGGAAAYLLLQSTDVGQVVWSLLLGFMLVTVVVRMLHPKANLTLMLMAPGVVGLVGYVWAAASYGSKEAALAAWYRGDMPTLALAMPIHYASAGVAGCALGIVWGHILHLDAPPQGAGDSKSSEPKKGEASQQAAKS